MSATHEIFGDVICSYTRVQAIEDGVLVDLSEMAAEAGFTWPVTVTRNVWDTLIEPNPMPEGQDAAGRLWDTLCWDTLWMLKLAIRRTKADGSMIRYSVQYVLKRRQRPNVELWAVVSAEAPDGGPCLTVMLPEDY